MDNLLHAVLVDERGGELLLRRDDDSILGLDAQRGGAVVDRVQRVLYLNELTRRAEGREREGVLRDGLIRSVFEDQTSKAKQSKTKERTGRLVEEGHKVKQLR